MAWIDMPMDIYLLVSAADRLPPAESPDTAKRLASTWIEAAFS